MNRTSRIGWMALGSLVLAAATAAPAFDSEKLAYNLKTTVHAYESVGKTNVAWDTEAKRGLMAFARLRSVTNSPGFEFIGELKAVLPVLRSKGCDDPLIRYLQARFDVDGTRSAREVADGYQRAASSLEASEYPALRKFYAAAWAYRETREAVAKDPELPSLLNAASTQLAKALDDRSMPVVEADEATEMLLSSFYWANPESWDCYQRLEPSLTNVWTGTALAERVKGQAYLAYAWQARGSGYADTVSKQGWRLFSERLRTAEESLEAAWKLDPNDVRICLTMVRVELGQGKGLARLDTWFQRGMKLDPSNYALCRAKIEYLRPRWYGSIRKMIEFGRECTFNTNYQGSVRLWLADAHFEASREIQDDQERKAYWQQKDVWPDVKVTFEQFFKLYPEETGYRHNYARYAYRCRQWPEFLNQVKLFPSTNHAYFGGLDLFNQMVEYAERQTREP